MTSRGIFLPFFALVMLSQSETTQSKGIFLFLIYVAKNEYLQFYYLSNMFFFRPICGRVWIYIGLLRRYFGRYP